MTTVLSEQEIATLVEGDLFISTGASISGINSLSEATLNEASFLGNEKYYQDFLGSKAGLVLAPTILKEAPEGIAIIHVANPSLAFATIAEKLASKAQEVTYAVSEHAHIAESASYPQGEVAIMHGAIIGENVSIAAGTVIHPGVVIGNGSSIGENTVIYPNVVIRENCQIGSRVILQPGCVIGSDGYGFELVDGAYKKIAQIGIVIIEDDVEIGANSTIDRARFGKTVIGHGTKLDNLVQVAHNVVTGPHNLLVAQSGLAGSTTTGAFVTVGAQAGTAGHLHVGDNVVIASQSGLGKTVNDGGYHQGSPARPIGETRKSRAMVNRLPKLLDRIKALEAKVKELES